MGRSGARGQKNQSSVWESIDLYRRIVESARDFAIFTIDKQDHITSWNRGAARILGYSEKEALRMLGAEVFVPEDRRKRAPQKEMATARREGRAEDERWQLRKDGSRFWGSGLMMQLRDDREQLVGYVKILRDLTARKQAQDDLLDLTHTLEDRVQQRTADLEDSQLRLAELARQLTRTERAERERIAADLHDHLGQMLAFAQMKIASISSSVSATDDVARDAREARDYLDEAIAYARALMANLSPPGLARGELMPALRWLVNDMAKHGLKVRLAGDCKTKWIAPDVQAVVFQAVRELLYNVRKHSRVAKASVRVSQRREELRVEVSDEGVGFGKGKKPLEANEKSGFGLFHVSQRLKSLGGELQMDRNRKKGTRAIVVVPIGSANAS